MNFSTLIGFLVSVTVFGAALLTSATSYQVFLDRRAMLIVVGGTAAASLVCFSLPKVFGLVKVVLRRLIGKSRRDYQRVITEIVALSQAYHRGKQDVGPAVEKLTDFFLKDAALVLSGLESEVGHEELRSLLECRVETHYERYIGEAEIFRVMSKFPPAFGLMGTTLGMVTLLQSVGQPDAKNLLGPGMAIALMATLYGIVLSNFLFIPIAENLTQQSKEDLICRRMVVEGVMLIASNKPTRFVEEKVKSFLLPHERGSNRAYATPKPDSDERKAA